MSAVARATARAAGGPRPSRPVATGDDTIAFRALLAFTVVLVGAPQGLFPALAPLRLAFVAALISVGTYVLHRVQGGAPLTHMEVEVRLVLALFALGVLSVPTSYWPGGSVAVLTGIFGKSVIIFLLLANLVSTLPRLRTMLWVLALVSALPAIAGIQNYLAGNLVLGRVEGYVGGLTGNPNDLALMLNIVLAMTVGLWLASEGAMQRLILLAVIGLCLAAIFVTKSRAGFVYLVVICILYSYRLKRAWKLALVFGAVFLTLSLTIEGFLERMATILDISADTTGSAEERWDGMKKGLGVMLAHPILGVGIGQDILALNALGSFWTRVHCVYIQAGADLGIPGFAAYLLFVGSAIRSVRQAARVWQGRRGRAYAYRLAEGIEVSLLGFAVAAVFYPVTYHFYFFYLAGLAVAVKRIARGDAAIGARDVG